MSKQSEPLSAAVTGALRAGLRGDLILPGDSGYDPARRMWNAFIDRRPCAIAHCADAEDVALALRIAADQGLRVTARGGGHNVAGRAIGDGVLLLDLSRLKAVSVNAAQRTAVVQGGALWRDLDAATASHDLATVGGMVSSTGVGGLTLGGGAGWLMRQHGLACDNLLRATVALPDGRFLHVSPSEHEDLFWGLRGGGGLAVTTSFEFRLHPLRNVLAGLVIHPASDALAALRHFRDFAADAPDPFCGLAALVHAPPLPFLAPEWHGRPVVIFALCWSGPLEEGAGVMRPLQSFGSPLVTHVALMPYTAWQQSQDPGAPAGRFHYWKTANFTAMSDAVLGELADMAPNLPTPQTEIHLQHMGGAVAREPAGETAFANRDARFFVNFIGATTTAEEFPRLREQVRACHDRIQATALPTVMPNFSGGDELDASRLYDAGRVKRLVELRRHYDPAGTLWRP